MLDINPLLLLFEVVLVLLLVRMVNATLFRPLLAHIDQRNGSLTKEADAASADLAEREKLLAQADATIAAAKHEAHKIRETMVAEAKASAVVKLDAARTAFAGRVAEFESALEQNAQELRLSLRGQKSSFGSAIEAKLKKAEG